MKKVFTLLTVAGMLTFGTFNSVYAQDAEAATEETMEVDSAAEAQAAALEAEAAKKAQEEKMATDAAAAEAAAVAPVEDESFTQVIKQKFIEEIGRASCRERV